jgi:hypothetical protein
MASIMSAAPQFLVEKLDESLAFYEQRLGFSATSFTKAFTPACPAIAQSSI